MAEPFVGEIRIFAFDYAPLGYAACDGKTMPISQNPALFSLIGNLYGGDGRGTFGLPNLQASVTAGVGLNGFQTVGTTLGSPSVTLTPASMANHSHGFKGQVSSQKADFVASPADQPYIGAGVNTNSKGKSSGLETYAPLSSSLTQFPLTTLSQIGGNQPHENRQPFLGVNYCIALEGRYPSFP